MSSARSGSGFIHGPPRWAASLPLLLALAGAGPANAAAAIDAHVQRLVRGLKLNAAQQAEVRRALEAQREAIRRLRSAPGDVPRVAALHAITDRTAGRIRAVLNDEQRKLYKQPLPRGFTPGAGGPGVDDWLNRLRREGK